MKKGSAKGILETVLQKDIVNIQETLRQTDPEVFEQAVETVLKAKHIYIVGVRNSAPPAEMLYAHLRLLFESVTLIETSSVSDMFEQMIHISEKDVVIGISFPRYSLRTLKLLEFANNRNAKVISMTDRINSPASLYSACNLVVPSELSTVSESMAAPVSLIGAFGTALTLRRKKRMTDTMEKLEEIWEEYGVYGSDELNRTVETVTLKNGEEKDE